MIGSLGTICAILAVAFAIAAVLCYRMRAMRPSSTTTATTITSILARSRRTARGISGRRRGAGALARTRTEMGSLTVHRDRLPDPHFSPEFLRHEFAFAHGTASSMTASCRRHRSGGISRSGGRSIRLASITGTRSSAAGSPRPSRSDRRRPSFRRRRSGRRRCRSRAPRCC